VALVGRAFGADGIVLTTEDDKLVKTINKVVDQFGGSYSISVEKKWKEYIENWKERDGHVIHLTMYGEHIDDSMKKLKELEGDILIVVGAEKVPRPIYELADLNIAVGNQPHSEIAALAVLLDRLSDGKGLKKDFDGKVKIIPNPRGKTVESNDG
jgi:tRNA (cytidine56-2'-O)-methyltransferase